VGLQRWVYIHQNAIYNSLPVSAKDLLTLYSATTFADSSRFQTGESAYRHAMFNPTSDGTPGAACLKATTFIEGQFQKAWNAEDRGAHDIAIFEFGVALHTLHDSTSPSHRGFQPWTGSESAAEIVRHVAGERSYPGRGSQLEEITREAWNSFSTRKMPNAGTLRCGCYK
jgi:hypothetical protein